MKILSITAIFAIFGLSFAYPSSENDDEYMKDKVTDLPGLVFETKYDQYAGYLLGNRTTGMYTTHHIFYWLMESQGDPMKDPVLFWFNGGPGCSSLGGGLFTENGPFHPNADGETLFENVHTWNKFANLVFIETPPGVGFSYLDIPIPVYDDDYAADMNQMAVNDFFMKHQRFNSSKYYLTGESYAGVYIPTLARNLIMSLEKNMTISNPNFAGIAIGNAFIDQKLQTNTVVEFFYYHGLLSDQKWADLKQQCCPDNVCPDQCNFYDSLIKVGAADWISDGSKCGNDTAYIITDLLNFEMSDPYNIYQSCYESRYHHVGRFIAPSETGGYSRGAMTANMINYDSTDNEAGLPCFGDSATTKYLNNPAVQDAIHIPQDWRTKMQNWSDCNMKVYGTWNNTYLSLDEVFDYIITSPAVPDDFKIMLYNGDVDTVCNFLGDNMFLQILAKRQKFNKTQERVRWSYGDGVMAGFVEQWNNRVTHLTVNGAGHFVPTDRPGPALQMIANFVWGQNNFSTATGLDDSFMPYVTPSSTPEPKPSADLIEYLPGVNFPVPFAQYSGYLKGDQSGMAHVFYWLTEAQTDPDMAPVVFWFNGGPGCSSMDGLFTELGPFHVSNDGGTSIFENVHSWNKVANMVFIESPPGVGFSFTDTWKILWSDDEVAELNRWAIDDFFKKYPAYKNRDFYITGESYGGVYIPTMSRQIVNAIGNMSFSNPNFKGFAIGNGYMDQQQQVNSVVEFMYYHGIIGYDYWQTIQKACCASSKSCPDTCDYWSHLLKDGAGDWKSDNTTCGNLTNAIAETLISYQLPDSYNIYQECYNKKVQLAAQISMPQFMMKDTARRINYESSDQLAGLPCFQDSNLGKYLNRADIQTALHVDPKWIKNIGKWADCNMNVYYNFTNTYISVDKVMDDLINQKSTKDPLRMLIYNGDVDTACNFLGDYRFMLNVTQKNKVKMTHERVKWMYKNQLAGYVESYTNIDILTVKGAGHFVPLDRSGPALQMLTNFLWNTSDYSMKTGVSERLLPTNDQFHPNPPTPPTMMPKAATSLMLKPIMLVFGLFFWAVRASSF